MCGVTTMDTVRNEYKYKNEKIVYCLNKITLHGNVFRGVCKDRSRWRYVVSAYPHGEKV